MPKVRHKRVMVRLVPGKGAAPDEVRFSPEEYAAVDKLRRRLKYQGISTLIRELCVKVASPPTRGGKGNVGDYDVLKAAAQACNLPLGEWMRLVALAACEFTPLESHLASARMVVRNTVQPLVD